MVRNWTLQLAQWLQHKAVRSASRRARANRPNAFDRTGAMISQLEVLESRRLLTNLVAVNVSSNAINLSDVSRGRVSTGDDFSVSYTSTSVVLTGSNGTLFKVGGQTLSTYTVSITQPVAISMRLNANANTVSVTGDGTAALTSLNINLGTGRQNNSLTLTNVVASSMNINGGRHDDSVKLTGCTINGDLRADLGRASGDRLDLESTQVKGNVRDWVGQLIVNQSTIMGSLQNVERGKNSTLAVTDSTFSGAVSVKMGRNGLVNLFSSADGPNNFHGPVTLNGARRGEIVVNQRQNSAVYDVTPTYHHATVNQLTATITAPTVNSKSFATATPQITGTYDAACART